GEKLPKKRLTPVMATDRIRLGSSGIEMIIEPVERVFSMAELEESSMKAEDRESLTNMIRGAHAEAARLVEVGKGIHDNYIETAEKKAAEREQQMAANYDHVMSQTAKQADELLENARATHDKIVGEAKAAAAQTTQATTERLLAE